jgi:hypothetical protein
MVGTLTGTPERVAGAHAQPAEAPPQTRTRRKSRTIAHRAAGQMQPGGRATRRHEYGYAMETVRDFAGRLHAQDQMGHMESGMNQPASAMHVIATYKGDPAIGDKYSVEVEWPAPSRTIQVHRSPTAWWPSRCSAGRHLMISFNVGRPGCTYSARPGAEMIEVIIREVIYLIVSSDERSGRGWTS